MAARVTDLDRLHMLLQRHSGRAVAKMLGVHHKTVQRWAAQERGITKGREVLVKVASKERAVVRREIKAQGLYVPKVAVLPEITRTMQIDPMDPRGRDRIPGEQMEIKSAKLRDTDYVAIIMDVAREMAKMGEAPIVRFLVMTMRYKQAGEHVEVLHWTRGSRITDAEDAEDAIDDALMAAGARGDILKIRIDDPYLTFAGGKKRRKARGRK